ncbi:MAG: phosphatidate cytidylyltransferase [Spirochaetia bacterium]|nr:phosphatidate cytidylyltransferase [Spirochaetia bacterium]
MSNFKLRLLLIFTVIPTLFATIFLLPFWHHICIHIVSTLFLTAGSVEILRILTGKSDKKSLLPAALIGLVISAVNYLECAEILPAGALLATAGILIFIIFSYQIFLRDENRFRDINSHITSLLVLVFYPGIFLTYPVKLTTLPHPSWTMVGFLVLVFMNDIFAYIFGMIWGKSNRNIFPISPKKSLAGFIGGFFASIAGAMIVYFMGAPMFGTNIMNAVSTGAIIGVLAPVGDLIESAMKRSAGVKDSGNYIPGRGGVMDNVDSIVFTAPVYYYIIKYIASLIG